MSQQSAHAEQGPIEQPPAPNAGPDRFLLAIVAGTVLLVLAAILAVFLFGRGNAVPPADPNSPAGVVQTYVEAVRSGDVAGSRAYLTREARAQAESRNRQNDYPSDRQDNIRIVVETVSATDTTAEVKVTVGRFYARSDPFSSGTSRYDLTVKLVREDGAWRISQPIEPYSLM